MNIWNAVYDILVEECQAFEDSRDHFVYHQTNDKNLGDMREWRFSGSLGFGGKFRKYPDRWYVDCYQEDETPERLAKIAKANARLETLHKEYFSESK